MATAVRPFSPGGKTRFSMLLRGTVPIRGPHCVPCRIISGRCRKGKNDRPVDARQFRHHARGVMYDYSPPCGESNFRLANLARGHVAEGRFFGTRKRFLEIRLL